MPLNRPNPAALIKSTSTTIVQLARLGDLMQSWPLVCALKEQSPARRVNLIVDEELVPIARLMTEPENVLGLPVKKLKQIARGSGQFKLLPELQKWAKALERLAADETINLNYHATAALAAELVPAPQHRGPRWSEVHRGVLPEGPCLELFRVNTGQRRGRRHLSDYWREYAGEPGLSFKAIQLNCAQHESSKEFLSEQGLNPDEPFAAIIIGSGHPARRWSSEGFQMVIAELLDSIPVALIGAPSEKTLATEILEGMEVSNYALQVISLCGMTSLDILPGIMARAKLAVGVDTGALHLAAALGTQCLGLYFGSMNFYETGPYGERHLVLAPGDLDYPCLESEMTTAKGKWMDSISAGGVVTAAKAILKFESPAELNPLGWVSHLTDQGCVWEAWRGSGDLQSLGL